MEKTTQSNTILENFNARYNLEVAGLPHGMAISMEELEAITLKVACESLPQEDGKISVSEIQALAEELVHQGKKSLNSNV
jgi:hypothetical protein